MYENPRGKIIKCHTILKTIYVDISFSWIERQYQKCQFFQIGL